MKILENMPELFTALAALLSGMAALVRECRKSHRLDTDCDDPSTRD